MPLYLLDTDHMSLLQRGGTAGTTLRRRLKAVGDDDYGTAIITFEEQMRGWLDLISRAKTRKAGLDAYYLFGQTIADYTRVAVWQYDNSSAETFESLQKMRTGVGTKDLKISAIALTYNATVLTCNHKHFSKVPELRIADWTV